MDQAIIGVGVSFGDFLKVKRVKRVESVIRNSCERLVNQRKSGCRKQLVRNGVC